jgi:hypothetical protein
LGKADGLKEVEEIVTMIVQIFDRRHQNCEIGEGLIGEQEVLDTREVGKFDSDVRQRRVGYQEILYYYDRLFT